MGQFSIGCPLPAFLHGALERLCCGIKGATWIEPSSLHLCLSAPGHLDHTKIYGLNEALTTLFFPPFSIGLQGIDFFPLNHQKKIIGVKVAPSTDIQRLQEIIYRALDKRDKNSFIPFIPLGFFPKNNEQRASLYCLENSNWHFSPVPLSHFAIYQSHTSERKVIYQALETFPLRDSKNQA